MIAVSPEQREGTACALCGRPLVEGEPVPVELPTSGTVVWVCSGDCWT